MSNAHTTRHRHLLDSSSPPSLSHPAAIVLLALGAKEYITMTKSRGFKEGRDNRTGQFVPLREAQRRPASTSVEVVPKRGHGDSGRYDKPKR